MLRASDESRTGTQHNPWNDRTVADMLDASVQAHGPSPAIVDGDRVIDFAELAGLRDGLAAALYERGVVDGTHVAVFMAKSWEYVVLLHALWSLGAVVAPLNTMWQADELGLALVESDAEVLVVGRFAGGRPIGTVIDDLSLPWGSMVADPRFPSLRQVIVAGDTVAGNDSAFHLRSLIDAGSATPTPRSSRQEGLILFSSGSTDRPKGVVLRQDGLLGTAHYYYSGGLGVGTEDRFVSLGPYFHAGGIIQLLGCNITGAVHYLFDGVDVPRIVDVALRDECTAMTGFDPVLNRILDEFDRRVARPPFTKVGCAPGTDSYERFVELGVHPLMMYALSEGGNIVTLTSPADFELGRMSNGRPLPGVTVTIRDPATGQEVPAGVEGEICFRGWNLFRGYYNLAPDQLGHEVLTDDEHFFHTKDIGRIDAEGRLYYLGRYAYMIKTGGENVSAPEVERFLAETFPEVVTAAVVGVPDPDWGEAVIAFVELSTESPPLDEAVMRAACRGRIAGYKIPKRILEVGAGRWPMTESGKLLKTSLRDTLTQPSAGDIPGDRRLPR